jgi:hypothetical protein
MATATPHPDFIRHALTASPLEFVAAWHHETAVSETFLQNEVLSIVLMCHRATLGVDGCCAETINTLRSRAPMTKCLYREVFEPFSKGRKQALGTLLLDPPEWARVLAQLPLIAAPTWFEAWHANWRRGFAKPAKAPDVRQPVGGSHRRPRTPDATTARIRQLLVLCKNDPEQHTGGRKGFLEELLKLPAAKAIVPGTLSKRILREVRRQTPATNLRPSDAD